MPPEADIHREVQDLRTKFGELEGTVRVVKHDVANVRMAQEGASRSIEKMDDKISGKIDALSDKVAGITAQQARGLGFFAGISFMITIPLVAIAGAVKLLFHP